MQQVVLRGLIAFLVSHPSMLFEPLLLALLQTTAGESLNRPRRPPSKGSMPPRAPER